MLKNKSFFGMIRRGRFRRFGLDATGAAAPNVTIKAAGVSVSSWRKQRTLIAMSDQVTSGGLRVGTVSRIGNTVASSLVD